MQITYNIRALDDFHNSIFKKKSFFNERLSAFLFHDI